MHKKINFKKLKITKKAVIITALLILTGVAGWFAPIILRSVEEAKQKQFEDKRLEAQDLRAMGKTDEAVKKVEDSLKDPGLTDDQRFYLYVERGNIPFDKGDYMAAIGFFEKAEQIRKDHFIVDSLAIAWDRAGNKERAIEYYKKTIELMPDSPLRGENIADAEKAIRRLGGTP